MVHVTTPKPPVQLIFSAARVSCRNPIASSSCARARLPASIAWTPPAVIRSASAASAAVSSPAINTVGFGPTVLAATSGVEGGVARLEHARGRPLRGQLGPWPSSLTLNPELGARRRRSCQAGKTPRSRLPLGRPLSFGAHNDVERPSDNDADNRGPPHPLPPGLEALCKPSAERRSLCPERTHPSPPTRCGL